MAEINGMDEWAAKLLQGIILALMEALDKPPVGVPERLEVSFKYKGRNVTASVYIDEEG